MIQAQGDRGANISNQSGFFYASLAGIGWCEIPTSSMVWPAWLKWEATFLHTLALRMSAKCSLKQSASMRPISPMYRSPHLKHVTQ